MLLIKNIQFTKLIKAEGRLREFNFRKANLDGQMLFGIDVTDDRGNRIIFRMHKEENTWKIEPQQLLPVWIINNEQNFHEYIETELRYIMAW